MLAVRLLDDDSAHSMVPRDVGGDGSLSGEVCAVSAANFQRKRSRLMPKSSLLLSLRMRVIAVLAVSISSSVHRRAARP